MRGVGDLQLTDSLFDPRSSESRRTEILYRQLHRGGKRHYRVYLYLEGGELPFVEQVDYRLHPTFRSPNRSVRRTLKNPQCVLEIWTWGLFEVRAIARLKDGQQLTLAHNMRYEEDFRKPGVRLREA